LSKQLKVSIEDLVPIIKDGLENNQEVELKVVGISMKPFLKDKESIVILKKYDGTLKRKHIYFYSIDEKYYLHRYIESTKSMNLFRGDALYNYELVELDNILGEVVLVKSAGKKYNPYSFVNKTKLRFYLVYKTIKSIFRSIIRRSNG